MRTLKHPAIYFLLALLLGVGTGLLGFMPLIKTASVISMIFVNLLKLISIPLIFLALVSTITQMTHGSEFRILGTKVLKYTLITTLLAALIGLIVFLLLKPVTHPETLLDVTETVETSHGTYWDYLLGSIPANLIQPFSEGNVIAVLILALMIGFATLALPTEQRGYLGQLFGSLFAAFLQIAKVILWFIPIVIWAFVTEFVATIDMQNSISTIGIYLACVVLANLIQAFVVLPAMLLYKGISPVRVFRGMAQALNVAFWSKSSAATLPITLQCAIDNLNISKKTANFSLPLCTAINMNGCAGFVIITVLFVCMSNGIDFSLLEMLAWVLVATLIAIGNAGVPMGCYFLSLALLSTMNVPLTLMFVILPFFVFLDMLETAINVWSDACVTSVVDAEIK